MAKVKFWKVVFGEEKDEHGNPTGNIDFKACIEANEPFCIQTEGFCDSITNTNVVVNYYISRKELEDFKEFGYTVLKDAIESKIPIMIEVEERPYGHCYGNCYWVGIVFEHVKDDLWKATPYRGSESWAVWQDIGMTGAKSDTAIYVRTKDVEELIEEFIEDPRSFDLDVGDWVNEKRGNADLSVNGLWGIDELIGASEEDYDAIIEVYDSEEFEQFLVKDYELDDTLREQLLDLIIDRYCWDEEDDREDIENVKQKLSESRTVLEFLEWFSETYW